MTQISERNTPARRAATGRSIPMEFAKKASFPPPLAPLARCGADLTKVQVLEVGAGAGDSGIIAGWLGARHVGAFAGRAGRVPTLPENAILITDVLAPDDIDAAHGLLSSIWARPFPRACGVDVYKIPNKTLPNLHTVVGVHPFHYGPLRHRAPGRMEVNARFFRRLHRLLPVGGECHFLGPTGILDRHSRGIGVSPETPGALVRRVEAGLKRLGQAFARGATRAAAERLLGDLEEGCYGLSDEVEVIMAVARATQRAHAHLRRVFPQADSILGRAGFKAFAQAFRHALFPTLDGIAARGATSRGGRSRVHRENPFLDLSTLDLLGIMGLGFDVRVQPLCPASTSLTGWKVDTGGGNKRTAAANTLLSFIRRRRDAPRRFHAEPTPLRLPTRHRWCDPQPPAPWPEDTGAPAHAPPPGARSPLHAAG